jgi:peptide/nickel transport system substrate-binding protein
MVARPGVQPLPKAGEGTPTSGHGAITISPVDKVAVASGPLGRHSVGPFACLTFIRVHSEGKPHVRTLRPRSLALAAAATATALLAAACSGSDDDGGSDSNSGDPVSGGALTFAVSANPACLDPHQLSEGVSLNVGRQVVDSLTDQNPDTGEIVPWIAESWEVNADSTQFTFTLRDDVTFSDGTKLTASVVKANFDDVVSLGAKSLLGSTYLAGYTGSEATDDTTLVVNFGQPSAQFLQASATITLGIMSESSLAASAADRCAGKYVGSGPFTLDSFTANQSIQLSKREGYAWNSPLAKHDGDAYLDSITFTIVPESGVRVGSLKSGQVNGIMDVQAQDEAGLRTGGYWLLTRANPGIVTSLIPNEARVLGDEDVRKAIQIGLNREEIVSTLYSEEYKTATSILSSTTPDYTDLGDDLEFDLDAAKKLLDDAGWKPGSDGIREKDGQRLTLKALGAAAAGELIQQQMKALGIELELIQATTSQAYLAVQASGDYDLAGYNLTRADPDVLKAIFSSKFTNVPKLQPSPLDQTLDSVSSESDPAKRSEFAAQAQETIVQEAHAFPINEQTQVFAFSDDVHDVAFEASTRMRLYDAWIS